MAIEAYAQEQLTMFWVLIFLIPFLAIILLFFIFWIVQEGSRWQKHRFLGGFARFIQSSAGRAFGIFAFLTFAIVPATLMLMVGVWWDVLAEGSAPSNTVPVVNTLLIMFVLLAAMIPVLWSSYRTWRQAVRSAADVRVRTTQG
ncbi:MAG: hypothetical protein ACFFED_10430 [Candidatus Thorarchaeota archaeon]